MPNEISFSQGDDALASFGDELVRGPHVFHFPPQHHLRNIGIFNSRLMRRTVISRGYGCPGLQVLRAFTSLLLRGPLMYLNTALVYMRRSAKSSLVQDVVIELRNFLDLQCMDCHGLPQASPSSPPRLAHHQLLYSPSSRTSSQPSGSSDR